MIISVQTLYIYHVSPLVRNQASYILFKYVWLFVSLWLFFSKTINSFNNEYSFKKSKTVNLGKQEVLSRYKTAKFS